MRSNSPSGGMKDHPPHKRSRGEEGAGDRQGGGVKSPCVGGLARLRRYPGRGSPRIPALRKHMP